MARHWLVPSSWLIRDCFILWGPVCSQGTLGRAVCLLLLVARRPQCDNTFYIHFGAWGDSVSSHPTGECDPGLKVWTSYRKLFSPETMAETNGWRFFLPILSRGNEELQFRSPAVMGPEASSLSYFSIRRLPAPIVLGLPPLLVRIPMASGCKPPVSALNFFLVSVTWGFLPYFKLSL